MESEGPRHTSPGSLRQGRAADAEESSCRPATTGGTRGRWQTWLACAALVLAGARGAATASEPALASDDPLPSAVAGASSSPGAVRWPRLAPDYREVVIPPNLAPLNLAIREPGSEYALRLSGSVGGAFEVRQSDPAVRFPPEEWRRLLEANRGGVLRWNIDVLSPTGEWVSYAPFETRVAEEAIDPYVVYRRLKPLYSTYRHLGIYQRHLESFEERPVLRNQTIGNGCVNCHTFLPGAPDRFALSLRGRSGPATLLVQSNRISRVDRKLGYLAWHPNGKLLAFADNEITQFFHLAGPMNRDVYDARSDLGILHVEDRRIEKPPAIAAPDRNENWPSWSPDGRYLYYCSGPVLAFEEARRFRYDLQRIPYDPHRNQWGQPERLLSGVEHGISAHQPRVSPDGRHVVFTMSESGSFPLFRPESDLFLLRLDTRQWERLPINSEHAETWHCWSSNGRWLLYVSRGLDGVFARLLITHVDRAARFSKPLLLPQENPAYYDTCLDNFNAPELARGPVPVSEEELARAYLTAGTAPAQPASEYRSHGSD